jgi:2-C-methyl-D-erythritol 2,4-cyclodiphosphate synthase
MRIGHSMDIHPFDHERKLVLGGVPIDHIGLRGHSDADVLLHVVAESILGALALGDLGTHFPDHDAQYRNKPSAFFVETAVSLMKQAGFRVSNIDCMVMTEMPKLSPYKKQIQERIASLLQVDIGQVSIKATTAEGMGFIGRAEGMLASATVLLVEV